jgi:small-conductance mechanosensitive channel
LSALQAPLPVARTGKRQIRGLPRPAQRALALGLALLLAVVVAAAGMPGFAAQPGGGSSGSGGGGSPAAADVPAQVGSFQLAPVRILGIPVLNVASPALGLAPGGSPDAATRARVIEGNLALLYRPRNLCTPSEWLAERILAVGLMHGQEKTCGDGGLNLRGHPEALWIEAEPQPGGSVLLQARVPERARALPLLTVTEEDARLNGTTTEQLARSWRTLLEWRLRYARRILTPAGLWSRWRWLALIELALASLLVGVLVLWRRSRQWMERVAVAPVRPALLGRGRGRPLATILNKLLLAAALAVLMTMAGVATFAVPGEMPLALDLLLQPVGVVLKLAVLGLVAALAKGLGRLLLSQWSARGGMPEERSARRGQRRQSLWLMTRRLIDLGAVTLVSVWVLAGIPGVRELSTSAVLASGALLGALAIVFQGLLRDFVAGLVVLFDDRYAIGDSVELGGLPGEVVDIGLLSTELRGTDQRVVTVPNSRCEPVVNLTKLRSGAELKLPLASTGLDLPRALAALGEETASFAADPRWAALLLEPPQVRGVSEVRTDGVWVSVLLATRAGRQGMVRRALLARLVERLGREGIPLASSTG